MCTLGIAGGVYFFGYGKSELVLSQSVIACIGRVFEVQQMSVAYCVRIIEGVFKVMIDFAVGAFGYCRQALIEILLGRAAAVFVVVRTNGNVRIVYEVLPRPSVFAVTYRYSRADSSVIVVAVAQVVSAVYIVSDIAVFIEGNLAFGSARYAVVDEHEQLFEREIAHRDFGRRARIGRYIYRMRIHERRFAVRAVIRYRAVAVYVTRIDAGKCIVVDVFAHLDGHFVRRRRRGGRG